MIRRRPYGVIFLTDGEPTIGETNEDALVRQATKESHGECASSALASATMSTRICSTA